MSDITEIVISERDDIMDKDKMFALINKAQLLWEGSLEQINSKALELTGIDLSEIQKFECARDDYKTLTRIKQYLFLYDSTPYNFNIIITPENTGNNINGSIYKLNLIDLCNDNNQIWSEGDGPDRERVHEAFFRLTGQKLSTTNEPKQDVGDGMYYLLNDFIVFLSYPGNNCIYKL